MYDMHDLRIKNRQELLSLISELKGKLLALRFETATGQLTETHLIKNTKQDIAKIFTVLKEQEQGIVIEEKPLPERSSKRRFGKREALTPLVEEDSIIEEQKIEEVPHSNLVDENAIVEKITDSPLKEEVEVEKIEETSSIEEVKEDLSIEKLEQDEEIVEKDSAIDEVIIEEKEEKGNS